MVNGKEEDSTGQRPPTQGGETKQPQQMDWAAVRNGPAAYQRIEIEHEEHKTRQNPKEGNEKQRPLIVHAVDSALHGAQRGLEEQQPIPGERPGTSRTRTSISAW